MTNFEKYKDDLMKIDRDFAFNKNTGKIVRCGSHIDCEDCLFNDVQCCFESDKIKWLYSEYEPPVLPDDELELIRVLSKINGKEYKYVVRDADGVIRLFETKPQLDKSGNLCGEYTYIDSASLDGKTLFSNITNEGALYSIENNCFIKEEREENEV